MRAKAIAKRFFLGSWKRVTLSVIFTISLLWWLFCLPSPLFQAPLATELLSTEGTLLSARIAADGQWRMPAADSISPKLRAAVIHYEDRAFYHHWGVSLRGIIRALKENWQAGKVVSGGSTITMQVARMARGNQRRSIWQKMIEASWATRLELRYSKAEILQFWLANAPYGGNVVGAEAATRRYYGRSPAELSWAEAATLAVLPNSPALIHPGRARSALEEKRNRLLDDLAAANYLSASEADLAKLEPLPEAPQPLPRVAEHLLERLRKEHGANRYQTSLEGSLQESLNLLVRQHHTVLAGNQIHNLAAMVTEVSTGRVVAYVGNVPKLDGKHGSEVDIITAPRSPGSLLKPILYGLAMDNGMLAPKELLPDIPTSFNEFQPANFHREFDGAVPADQALARSLNIPFVYLLKDYGVPLLHQHLQTYHFGQLTQPADHYGLSLILGGGEITMEEITGWFLGLARQQRFFYQRQGWYQERDFRGPTLLNNTSNGPLETLRQEAGPIGAGAGYLTLEALTSLSRPDETGASHRFSSHQRIAWKTGTSFGFRDAWAVGCTPAYVVSVWAGNANGEGRTGLVGVKAAAPLLFQIFRMLARKAPDAPRWFEAPYDDLRQVSTCKVSGSLASPNCPVATIWQAKNAERNGACQFHARIFTNAEQTFQARKDCVTEELVPVNWFTLPPRQAHFYQRRNPDYRSQPPLHAACEANVNQSANNPIQLIYPYQNGVLSPVKNWKGKIEPFLFEVAHQRENATIFWHLDQKYVTATAAFHSLSMDISPGNHLLTVVDDRGFRLEHSFTVK
ncbi:MAG: penicillin-binding protein 1C [Bacteroidota bacterium]